ncbi:cytochrome b [Thalassotalea agarivorans]|uniref:Cytochrome b561 n=1 Tax=Thalassotalea agarivorans TaxID=349064 RepID=A0A1I0G9X8_THASX|nr:cytochrome b [Thalassotalea agarivorans]SET67566.1 cytochrome b561 [Thalassotalea agarivorans]
MELDTKEKLSSKTIVLHWIVGVMMIILLAVGVYMTETENHALYPIHKSFGVLILIFVVPRVFWRMKNGWPEPVSQYSMIEITLSKLIHWVLIIGTVLMPVSGMMMSGYGGHGIAIFGLELVPMNFDPTNPKEVIPINGALAGLGHQMHGLIGNILIGAIVLHFAGALKHHLIDKDGTMRRMLGK